MSSKLLLISFLYAIIIIFFILFLLKKEKINIKYAIIWLLLFGLLAFLLLIPNSFTLISNILGFQMSSNMIFAILISVLIIINISLTAIASTQDMKIRKIIQEVSILKMKYERDKKDEKE